MNTTDTELEQLARRRAKAKIGWFCHAAVYTLVNLGLIASSLLTGRHWAAPPLLGWGLGLLLHGISVWLLTPGGTLFAHQLERERARLQARARNG